MVGHAPDQITVVSSISELDEYPAWTERKLGLTVQTTHRIEDFRDFELAARAKWPQIKTFDTICAATNQLQSAVHDLAPAVDMILVVGSETSANSKRLARISQSLCGRGELIGSAADIKGEWFTGENSGITRIGVTAGASTPDFLVEAVIERLKALSEGKASVVRLVSDKGKKETPACES